MLKFVHNKSDTDNHLTAITKFLAEAETAFICSGHLKVGGVEVLSDALKQAVARGARITVYPNLGDGDGSLWSLPRR